MAKRRRKALPNIVHKAPAGEAEMPSLLELDRFNEANLRQWTTAATRLQALYAALYFELEPKRQKDSQRLLDALRSRAIQDFNFKNWGRVVDFRYSSQPLSMDGSVKGVGGRFNIGEEISPGTFSSFPALYLGEDAETAFRERFGAPSHSQKGGLTGLELALRSETSFASCRLHGRLDFVIDVGDLNSLQPFVDVIKDYPLPKTVRTVARNMAMQRPPWLIRSPISLQRHLLHPNWRAWPMQFSLPANSQIFARYVAAAGLHGILYPSTKNSEKRCLALFPKNWEGTTSFVELSDPAPSTVHVTRIDGGKITIQ